MRVGQRLFLAVIPAVLGVLTVAALGYWGEYGRHAPYAIVVTAAFASVISLGVAWYNTRYVARSIERLAAEAKTVRRRVAEAGVEAIRAAGLGEARPDELESVERLLERLAGATIAAERSARSRQSEAESRARLHDALLTDAASALALSLDEIRLPLHILLENKFGDLNENQEEMLGSARSAAEAADAQLRTVATTIAASSGTLTLRRDRIRGGELVEGLLALLRAQALERSAHLEADIGAPLPSLSGDRAYLQEALRSLFGTAMGAADATKPIRLLADATTQSLRLRLDYSGSSVSGLPRVFGESLVSAHGGNVATRDGDLTVTLSLAGVQLAPPAEPRGAGRGDPPQE
jgi:signal transduction histidine kinase